MRHHHIDYPELSRDDWYAVADAAWAAEAAPRHSVFSTIANRLKAALGLGENPSPQSDPCTRLMREFVMRARQSGSPDEELAGALLSSGFSAAQVTALTLLSVH